ncbi:amidohydrolase [Candidatus Acetothermia bacterium]|nr:amidohydrolase [Candidatus Acetothermia bacterium]
MRIIIKNVTLVDGLRVNEGCDIDIKDRLITRISPAKVNPGDREELNGVQIIDGAGRLAFPGFINAHTHLSMVLFRGLADDLPLKEWLEREIWPIEKNLQPHEVYWFALLGMAEMIRSGTTAFADMYFYMDEVARAVEESGMRALLAYGIIAESYNAHGRRELEIARNLITDWHGKATGRINVALAPHSPYTCSYDILEKTRDIAVSTGVMIHTHLSETTDEVERSYAERGMSPVQYLASLDLFSVPTLAAHCVHVNEADIALLAEHNVMVAYNPTSNAKLASGIAPVVQMKAAGVNVALGTDGAASNNNLDMLEEMRWAALLQKVATKDPTAIPAIEALRMATCNGATAIGINESVGRLSVGKRADIVLMDIDKVNMLPSYDYISDLVYAANSQTITDVIVDGQILMSQGHLTTIDEERVKAKARELSVRYRK